MTRTTCACRDCVQCCRDQPASLAPGDFVKIADHLQIPEADRATFAKAHFWASPGAVAGRYEKGILVQFKVGTVTPQRVNGKCVFLGDDDRCKVHPVAPFGCAFFDTHMSAEEGHRRSMVHIQEIMATPAYAAWRSTLPIASSWKPRRHSAEFLERIR